MNHHVFFTGRGAFADASDLIDRFGVEAGSEAKQRASQSRDLGNVVRFCHWRETERLIDAMTAVGASGPLQ